MRKKEFMDFRFWKLNQATQNIAYVFVAFCIFAIVSYIAWYQVELHVIAVDTVWVALSVFITGPACAVWGYNRGRSEDFAFLWGLVFGLFGVIPYWLYTLLFDDRKEDFIL